MKRKMIVSLFLVICCIITSIPVGAAENGCSYHKYEYAWCVYSHTVNMHHTYTKPNGTQHTCNYSDVYYIEIEYCIECGETREGQTHLHRVEAHECGAVNGTVCPAG